MALFSVRTRNFLLTFLENVPIYNQIYINQVKQITRRMQGSHKKIANVRNRQRTMHSPSGTTQGSIMGFPTKHMRFTQKCGPKDYSNWPYSGNTFIFGTDCRSMFAIKIIGPGLVLSKAVMTILYECDTNNKWSFPDV